MALASYSDLIAAVPDVMARSTDTALIAYLPVAVALLEASLNRTLRVGPMEAATVLTGSSGVFTLPADYAGFRQVRDATYGPLEEVTPDWASDAYPTALSGIPMYFTIKGSSLTTYPATTSTVALDYYQKIPGLQSNSTNWLMTNHPDVYLFGVLAEAYLYSQDTETASLWNDRLKGALGEIGSLDIAKRYGRVAARVKGPTP